MSYYISHKTADVINYPWLNLSQSLLAKRWHQLCVFLIGSWVTCPQPLSLYSAKNSGVLNHDTCPIHLALIWGYFMISSYQVTFTVVADSTLEVIRNFSRCGTHTQHTHTRNCHLKCLLIVMTVAVKTCFTIIFPLVASSPNTVN